MDEMSEGEYQALDQGPCPEDIWVTRDKRVILISAMADSHLLNTIRFLRRRTVVYQMSELSRMGCYIANASDGAADACESEAFRIMQLDGDEYLRYRFGCFRVMLAEARMRGLTI